VYFNLLLWTITLKVYKMIKTLFNLSILFLLGTSVGLAQSNQCSFANQQVNVVPANTLLGSISNADNAVDNDENSASSLIVNANLVDMGLVSQDLIFPTISTVGEKITIKFGYSGGGLPTLASVSNAVTIETLNGTVANGDAAPLNSNLVQAVNGGQQFVYTITPTATFDRVRITLGVSTLPVLGAFAQIDLYYGCKGSNAPNFIGPRSISPTNVEVIRSQTCLAAVCAVTDSHLVADRDLNTAATINIPIALAGASSTISSQFANGIPKDTVTIAFGEITQLLDLAASGGGITVESFKSGVSNGDMVTLTTNLLTVINNLNSVYSFRPSYTYDEIRVGVFYPTVGTNLTLKTVSVFEVYRNPYIERPLQVVDSKTCLPVSNTNTVGTTATIASVSNPANAIDADLSNYSTLTVIAGVLGTVSATQYIGLSKNGCNGDTIAFTFQDDNSNPLSLSLLGQITLELLDTTAVVFSQQASFSLVTVSQTGSQSVAKVAAPAKYNGVRIILNSGAIVGVTNAIRFFGICASSTVPPAPNLTASSVVACNGQSAVLALDTVTGFNYEWFDVANPAPGQTPIFVGNVFSTPAPNTTVGMDTFYVRAVSTTTGCTNNFLNIIPYEILDSIPTPVVSPNPMFVCKGQLSSISFNPTNPYTGTWWSALSGGQQLSLNDSLQIPTTFGDSAIYYAQQNSAQCPSKRRRVVVYGQNKPAAPVLACNDQQSINGNIAFLVVPTGTLPVGATGLEYMIKNSSNIIALPVGNTSSVTLSGFSPNQTIEIAVRYVIPTHPCGASEFSAFLPCQNRDCPPGIDTTINFVSNPDTNACSNQTVNFFDLTPNAVSWNWNFGDGGTSTDKNPTHAYQTPGDKDVTLTVVFQNCLAPQSRTKQQFIAISDCGLQLPNAFSPNGDNINDSFGMLVNAGILTSYLFEVYNQWGQRVFSSDDPAIKWDGRFENKDQPAGSYAYRYRVKFINELGNQEGSGSVLLVR
jgi:gliding motility-associated-like protein